MDLSHAVEIWKQQLVDTTGRNPLLVFRPRKRSTMQFVGGTAGEIIKDEVLGKFLRGEQVSATEMFVPEAHASILADLRLISRHAQSNSEERGVRTLFVAHGMASWDAAPGAPKPFAPVLLQGASLKQRGRTNDWLLEVSMEDWEFNPLLVHVMGKEHGIDLSELIEYEIEGASFKDATEKFYVELLKRCNGIAGFNVVRESHLANFSYEKISLVADLEKALRSGLLATNPLVSAIAGDSQSIKDIQLPKDVDYSFPDACDPLKEFLVLDADSSQSAAIKAVLDGASIVIEGPPGTGKSQTIANLIAALSAEGKKVLFVAEKRAAIEAVTKRLDAVGLGDIVLDMHEGVRSRRAMYQQIEQVLKNNSRVLRPDTTSNDELLRQRRGYLSEYSTALHELRQPWGVSVHDCQNSLLISNVSTSLRLTSDVLYALDKRTVAQIKEHLRQFVSLGGLELETKQNDPWFAAYHMGHLGSGEVAARTLEAVQNYRYRTLEDVLRVFQKATGETMLPPATSFSGWRQYFELWERTQNIFNVFKSDLYEHNPELLLDELESVSGNRLSGLVASFVNDDFKRARDAVQALTYDEIPVDVMRKHLQDAVLLMHDWRIVAQNDSVPSLPSMELGVLYEIYDDFVEATERIERWVGAHGWMALPIKTLISWIEGLLKHSSTLYRLPELTDLRAKIVGKGLAPLLTEASRQNLGVLDSLALLDFVWHASILERVMLTDTSVGTFAGAMYDQAVEDFCAADKEHIRLGAAKVRRLVAERSHLMMEAQPQQATFIRQQARLKRGHMPPRMFLSKVANLATTVKPCWAVSPLMVAQLLPQRKLFDVVIFDEASQVRPAEAIGSILRSNQVVVAGDPKQLPPTSFFSSTEIEPVTYSDDEDDDEFMVDAESILDVMTSLFSTATFTLSWHYRSRDDKLIAFSNAQTSLYDWALTTFPGAVKESVLRHELVELSQQTPAYVDAEAQRVVELVKEHVKFRPSRSLGIIAMGITHAERINDALFVAQQTDTKLAEWISGGAPTQNGEALFVKNLERVQGDERDDIILSVGYGKNEQGGMVYRFGPLNMEGGERRLNVAITRARQSMTVVSSFVSTDIDPTRLNAEGARMLRDYLAYVESHGSELGRLTPQKNELSPIEQNILEVLTDLGLPVVAQYGVSQPYVDFAIAHPDNPDWMVLAIECDGDSYRSANTVRDRERLRKENLERLGWSFCRLWTPEWLNNPEQEVQRIIDGYNTAVKNNKNTKTASAPSSGSSPVVSPVAGGVTGLPPKMLPFPISHGKVGSPINSYTKMELVELMRWIESDGLLRTETDLVNEAFTVLKFGRKGQAINRALLEAAKTSRYRIQQ
jgi:very-short-patch-repair endonuclease